MQIWLMYHYRIRLDCFTNGVGFNDEHKVTPSALSTFVISEKHLEYLAKRQTCDVFVITVVQRVFVDDELGQVDVGHLHRICSVLPPKKEVVVAEAEALEHDGTGLRIKRKETEMHVTADRC